LHARILEEKDHPPSPQPSPLKGEGDQGSDFSEAPPVMVESPLKTTEWIESRIILIFFRY
jgi:hypothetical protein